jgi:hypothetical protein
MDAAALRPARAGFWRGITRWMVEHPKVVIALGLVLWLASCAGVWSYALKAGIIADELTAKRQWLAQLQIWPGCALVPAALIWLWRWHRAITGDNERNATVLRPARPGLAALVERRLVEREPVPYELLPRFVRLGAVGIAIGVLLSYWLAVLVNGGGATGRGTMYALIAVAILSILTVSFAMKMLREVFFLWNDDYFIAGKEDEVVAQLEDEQRQNAEAEREYERKTLSRGQIALLYVGFLGGGMLMLKFLGDKDGVIAFQAMVSSMIATSVWMYTTRLRPRAWRIGLALTLIGSVAFVIFTIHSWGLSWLPLGLGLIYGAGIGIASTLLYVRKLRR